MPEFARTINGRWRVLLGGVWIGTIAPVPGTKGAEWWYVPRGGAGHIRYAQADGAMRALLKEFMHG